MANSKDKIYNLGGGVFNLRTRFEEHGLSIVPSHDNGALNK